MANEKDVLIVQGVNSKGYGIIPKLVMQDKRLTIESKAIYSYFCSYAGAGSQAFPRVDKILSDLCICRERYYKHLESLKAIGYIVSYQNKTNGSKFANTVYTLCTNVAIEPKKPCTEFPTTEFPYAENQYTNSNSIKINSIKINKTTTTGAKAEKDVVVADALKKEIDEKLKAKISKSSINDLLDKFGTDKVRYYLDNWDKFKGIGKNNVVGYFIKAVTDGYELPKAENSIDNMCNFEQREYKKEDFEKYYYKVGGDT